MDMQTLIDLASKPVKTKAALARVLGVSPTRVNDWHKGHRPCPMEVQLRLCDIAELSDEMCLAHLRDAAQLSPKKCLVGETEYSLLAAVACVVSVAALMPDALRCIFRKARTIRVMSTRSCPNI